MIVSELNEIQPRTKYFDETGLVIAWKKCGQQKYAKYYMIDSNGITAQLISGEVDFLDFPDEDLIEMFSIFEDALECLNGGKIWDGPFQVSLDKWIKRE